MVSEIDFSLTGAFGTRPRCKLREIATIDPKTQQPHDHLTLLAIARDTLSHRCWAHREVGPAVLAIPLPSNLAGRQALITAFGKVAVAGLVAPGPVRSNAKGT